MQIQHSYFFKEENMEEKIIKTLKELLNYKTVKGNKEEFSKIFKYIKNHTNDNLYIKEYQFKDNMALVISNAETTNFDIIFCTHIDIVPAEDYKYYEDEENIYGRGTIDMKGSVAVLLELLNNIKTTKNIALFITSDEEFDGNCAKELAKLYNAKLAIVPDGGTNFDLIKEEKGLLQLSLSIKTKSAHSSQPFNGTNAIVELIKAYELLLNKYPLPKNAEDYITSVNLSKLNGGIATNQVPDYAEAVLDIRYTSNTTTEEILNEIRKINSKLEIKVLGQGPIFKCDIENKMVKEYIKSCEDILKRKINIIGCESTSDAIYFSEQNIPTIIMNPDGYYAHCPNEYVNKKSLNNLYLIYQNFIERSDKDE